MGDEIDKITMSNAFKVSAKNLSESPQDADIPYEIIRLRMPEVYLHNRKNDQPNMSNTEKEKFKTALPYLALEDENLPEKWEELTVI